jgi:hypothetical protein
VVSFEVGLTAVGQHRESLLVEGPLMACLDMVIYYILEDLNYQAQVEVAALDQIAVLKVCLTVADEHPETLFLHDV